MVRFKTTRIGSEPCRGYIRSDVLAGETLGVKRNVASDVVSAMHWILRIKRRRRFNEAETAFSSCRGEL